ncbi:putative ribonuclease H domain-containing protein [Arabidopsis thaliana]
MHLLFQCRLAKEICALSPLHIPSGQYEESSSLLYIMHDLITTHRSSREKDYLFPYIGWHMWKARNDLLYNNKRWAIPDIINKAIMDFDLWKLAQQTTVNQEPHHEGDPKPPNTQNSQKPRPNSPFYCYTDGSWVDSNSTAGIGWVLYDAQGTCLLKGSAALEPMNSALETEAIALREALVQMRRLSYKQVTFCGDSRILYGHLEKVSKQNPPDYGPSEI